MDVEPDMQDDAMTSGQAFRHRRLEHGITQADLQEATGITDNTIRKLEKDERISVAYERRLVAALTELIEKAGRPPVEMIEVPKEDLRAVLNELRALRRRVEDLATRIEGPT